MKWQKTQSLHPEARRNGIGQIQHTPKPVVRNRQIQIKRTKFSKNYSSSHNLEVENASLPKMSLVS